MLALSARWGHNSPVAFPYYAQEVKGNVPHR